MVMLFTTWYENPHLRTHTVAIEFSKHALQMSTILGYFV